MIYRTVTSLTRRSPNAISITVILVALLGLFGRSLYPGIAAHHRDTDAFYLPLAVWFAERLAAGTFPLWCQLIFSGYPIFADGELGMLHPVNLLLVLALPTEAAYVVGRATCIALASIGTFLLARAVGVTRLGAVLAGIAFGLGGFNIGHLDHPNILRSAASLPWLLWSAQRAMDARGIRAARWAVVSALALGTACLGLHPQVVLIELAALGGVCGLRTLIDVHRRYAHDGIRPIARLLLGRAAIAMGIAVGGMAAGAIQLLPTVELGMFSSRGAGLPYWQASLGALGPLDLLTLALPYFFRDGSLSAWARYPIWETTTTIGAVALGLSIVGAIGWSGPARSWLALAAVTFGLVALGPQSPVDLYSLLASLPGYSSMRMPARYGVVMELMLAVLAGAGADMIRGRFARRHAVLAPVGVAALLASALATLGWLARSPDSPTLRTIVDAYLQLPRGWERLDAGQVLAGIQHSTSATNGWTILGISGLVAPIGFAWLARRAPGSRSHIVGLAMVSVVATELLLLAHAFNPTIPMDRLSARFLPTGWLQGGENSRLFIRGTSDHSITNRTVIDGLAQTYGYSSIPTTRVERFWRRVNETDDELLDVWGARYVLEPKHWQWGAWVDGVLFSPVGPLIKGPANNPLGHESFRIAPHLADRVVLLSAVDEAPLLPDGAAIAHVTISGPGLPSERLTLRAGVETAESAYDDPLATTRPAHARPHIGFRWLPRDPQGNAYVRNFYRAEFSLQRPRLVDRVEVTTVAAHGRFRLGGLSLVESQTNRVGALTPRHRDKYVLLHENEHWFVHENRAAVPRAFVARASREVDADDWSYMHLQRRDVDPVRDVLIERGDDGDIVDWILRIDEAQADEGDTPRRLALSREASASIQYSSDNRVVVHATAPAPSHLVILDTFYPGWHARVNGEAATVVRANYLFKAVAIPPGSSVVELDFAPASVMLGALVSAATLVVFAGIWMAPWWSIVRQLPFRFKRSLVNRSAQCARSASPPVLSRSSPNSTTPVPRL
jgi:hypothetical protein